MTLSFFRVNEVENWKNKLVIQRFKCCYGGGRIQNTRKKTRGSPPLPSFTIIINSMHVFFKVEKYPFMAIIKWCSGIRYASWHHGTLKRQGQSMPVSQKKNSRSFMEGPWLTSLDWPGLASECSVMPWSVSNPWASFDDRREWVFFYFEEDMHRVDDDSEWW